MGFVLPMFGKTHMEPALLALDVAIIDSALLLRSLGRSGLFPFLFGLSCTDLLLFVLDCTSMELPLLLHSLGCLGLAFLVFGTA